MKRLFIILISFYQNFFSVFIKSIAGVNSSCRFSETCSEYGKRLIEEKGIMGVGFIFIRLLKCQPFYKENLNGYI